MPEIVKTVEEILTKEKAQKLLDESECGGIK